MFIDVKLLTVHEAVDFELDDVDDYQLFRNSIIVKGVGTDRAYVIFYVVEHTVLNSIKIMRIRSIGCLCKNPEDYIHMMKELFSHLITYARQNSIIKIVGRAEVGSTELYLLTQIFGFSAFKRKGLDDQQRVVELEVAKYESKAFP